VMLAKTEAFTEGEWRGRDGAVRFVANHMDVLEGVWLRVDEHIGAGEDQLVVAITFGGRARHTGIAVRCMQARRCGRRSSRAVPRPSKP
jgi:hypothetical protein